MISQTLIALNLVLSLVFGSSVSSLESSLDSSIKDVSLAMASRARSVIPKSPFTADSSLELIALVDKDFQLQAPKWIQETTSKKLQQSQTPDQVNSLALDMTRSLERRYTTLVEKHSHVLVLKSSTQSTPFVALSKRAGWGTILKWWFIVPCVGLLFTMAMSAIASYIFAHMDLS